MSLDRPGVIGAAGSGIRELARLHGKHIVVVQGTASPYLVPRGRDAAVRAWVARLTWAEPVFHKDLAAFALEVTKETAIGLGFRPLAGTQHPACETAAAPSSVADMEELLNLAYRYDIPGDNYWFGESDPDFSFFKDDATEFRLKYRLDPSLEADARYSPFFEIGRGLNAAVITIAEPMIGLVQRALAKRLPTLEQLEFVVAIVVAKFIRGLILSETGVEAMLKDLAKRAGVIGILLIIGFFALKRALQARIKGGLEEVEKQITEVIKVVAMQITELNVNKQISSVNEIEKSVKPVEKDPPR